MYYWLGMTHMVEFLQVFKFFPFLMNTLDYTCRSDSKGSGPTSHTFHKGTTVLDPHYTHKMKKKNNNPRHADSFSFPSPFLKERHDSRPCIS